MTGSMVDFTSATVEMCINYCYAAGFMYAGLESDDCFCDDEYQGLYIPTK